MNQLIYQFDPTQHNYPNVRPYPLLVFCTNFAKKCAEAFSTPSYQSDFQGAYILVPSGDFSCDFSLQSLNDLITDFSISHRWNIGKKFLIFDSSIVAAAVYHYTSSCFDALVSVGLNWTPDDMAAADFTKNNVKVFHMKDLDAVLSNLKNEDGTLTDQRYPRGLSGWIDEVSRGGRADAREYISHRTLVRTGHVHVSDRVTLFFEEYGSGDRIILSAQIGFYHRGMHQRMADLGYHVYCITLRGFHPSSLISEDYGDRWYDVFASDVIAFANHMGIQRFSYMGASHGAGVGWHLMLQAQERIDAFIAVVPGPHSLAEGTMSYRQMMEQGIIQTLPPFDPPIDSDPARQIRRDYRERWIFKGLKPFEEESKLDYGRPMMRFGSEEKLCEALRSITVPVLMIGGYNDPISTPALMMRTAGCLPHCKWIVYTNCGHNIDTDLIEEVSDEADRFIRNVLNTGKIYLPLE